MIDDQRLRPATPEDWEALLGLLYVMGSQTDERARQRFTQLVTNSDHYLPVVVDDTRLSGYGWVQDYGPHLRSGDHTARLHDLFVIPTHRGQGLGAALFMAIRVWVENRGIRYLEWQASQAAVPFYERLGYKGDPCPQPEYPFFEIEFPARAE